MNLEDISKLKSFKDYSYGSIAMRKWYAGMQLRTLDLQKFYAEVADNYCMACEQLMKHILTRTNGLDTSRLYTHSYRGLADDIDYPGRRKHSQLLRYFSQYYREGRYEPQPGMKEDFQTLQDFFGLEETYEEADEVLFDLYTMARDVENIAKESSKDDLGSKTKIKRMNLI